MNLLDKGKTIFDVARFLMTVKKYDPDYLPQVSGAREGLFVSARKAASLIRDGATVMSTGMAGNSRCSVFYYAIRQAWEKAGSPRDLTWMAVSAIGARGRIPGSVEELGQDGLVKEYISGHVETCKAMLNLGQQRKIHIHTMPQGQITELLSAQAEKKRTVSTHIGIDTFLDPACGGSTAVTPHTSTSYVTRDGDALTYTMPGIDVGLFNAPYADREGNIYFDHAATITENVEVAKAAKANGGKVMVSVSKIIEKNSSRIGLEKEYVDHIVVHPGNEQTAMVCQKNYWPMLTVGATEDLEKSISKLKFVNKLVKVASKRGPVDNALARLAASRFVKLVARGSLVNLGIGLPEEVGRLLYEGGVFKNYTFSSETGVYGGLPTPGMYFGGAINPEKMISSAQIFQHYKTNLAATVLGTLQVDSRGNVNVSRRGKNVMDYVGPGGFMNISDCARTIIFVGSWMAKAEYEIKNGSIRMLKPGIPKFVSEINEVTFNAEQALKAKKTVIYVTTVGVFRLTPEGVRLEAVMPGIDIEKDIVRCSTSRIIIPENVETISESILTGDGFSLKIPR